jgi:ABC-type molybdenum transport system ATPase subunit/photorepair protein PhrA
MQVEDEPSGPTLQPGMSERAMDTASDVSRTIGEVSANLKAAMARLSEALDEVQSGTVASSLRRAARQAPLTSLFAAFLLGTALARARRR